MSPLVEDGRLQELFLERTSVSKTARCKKRTDGRHGHSLIGNIMLGRVQRVLPGMQAAFVDVGLERAGFLGAREARCLADLPGFDEERTPKIGDCVHEGEEVLVQVVKDPIGEKGARLSANVTIPGRLAVTRAKHSRASRFRGASRTKASANGCSRSAKP